MLKIIEYKANAQHRKIKRIWRELTGIIQSISLWESIFVNQPMELESVWSFSYNEAYLPHLRNITVDRFAPCLRQIKISFVSHLGLVLTWHSKQIKEGKKNSPVRTFVNKQHKVHYVGNPILSADWKAISHRLDMKIANFLLFEEVEKVFNGNWMRSLFCLFIIIHLICWGYMWAL